MYTFAAPYVFVYEIKNLPMCLVTVVMACLQHKQCSPFLTQKVT